MQTPRISHGTTVEFESPEGPQRGTVAKIVSDIAHNRRLAIINVPGTLNDQPWLMVTTDLRLAEPTSH